MSNVAEYVRIDRPVSCQYPRMKAFNPVLMQQQQQQQHPFPGPRTIDTLKSSGKQTKFLADMDDSVIAPSTLFTKKWQLHNLGSSNWPRGTQLVWDEGDKLSDSTSFEIQVENGDCLFFFSSFSKLFLTSSFILGTCWWTSSGTSN